jgi:hypothetical protein
MRSISPEMMTAGVTASDSGAGGASLTLAQVVGFLNVMAGLILVAAILFFVGGFIGWITRLGLTGRDDGIYYMRWSVYLLFVLVVGLALINFVQFHTQLVLAILGVVIVLVLAWVILQIAASSGGDEETK